MCQYMLIIPTLTDVLRRIEVSTGLVGAIAGASDFASMFMTPGATPSTQLPASSDMAASHPQRTLCIHGQRLNLMHTWLSSVIRAAFCCWVCRSVLRPHPSASVEGQQTGRCNHLQTQAPHPRTANCWSVILQAEQRLFMTVSRLQRVDQVQLQDAGAGGRADVPAQQRAVHPVLRGALPVAAGAVALRPGLW